MNSVARLQRIADVWNQVDNPFPFTGTVVTTDLRNQ